MTFTTATALTWLLWLLNVGAAEMLRVLHHLVKEQFEVL